MKKLLIMTLIGLSCAQAAALCPEDQTELHTREERVARMRRQVDDLHQKIDQEVQETARFKSAAHVRHAEKQKAPAVEVKE